MESGAAEEMDARDYGQGLTRGARRVSRVTCRLHLSDWGMRGHLQVWSTKAKTFWDVNQPILASLICDRNILKGLVRRIWV